MRRIVTGTLSLLLALVGLAAWSAPANAAAPTLTVPDTTAPSTSGCATVSYTYNADPPAGFSSVSVYLYVRDSDYNDHGSVSSSTATRSGTLTACGVTSGSPYVMEMSVSACNSSYSSCQYYDGPDATFYVGPRPVSPPPPTVQPVPTLVGAKVTLKRRSLGATDTAKNYQLDADGTLTYSDNSTMAPVGSATLQYRYDKRSSWKIVRGTERPIKSSGSARWLVNTGRLTYVRAVYKSTSGTINSKVVKLAGVRR